MCFDTSFIIGPCYCSTNVDILKNNRSVNVDYSRGTPSGKSHCTGMGDLLAHSHEHLD